MKIPIVEAFTSIQGEGPQTGLKFFFIRVAGCNIRCNYCDSQYTWKINDNQYVDCDSLISKILLSRCDWVSITGGEPLLYPEQVSYLLKNIHKAGLQSHLETNGKIYDPTCFNSSDIVSMDIKTPCTGYDSVSDFKNIDHLRYNDYIKCLIRDDEDLKYARQVSLYKKRRCELILQVFNDFNGILFKEQLIRLYLKSYRTLVELILNDKDGWFRTRVTPQMHFLLWHGQHGR